MSYQAPIRDYQFLIKELSGLQSLRCGPAHAELDEATIDAVLEHAGAFYEEVPAPTNEGKGAKFDQGRVTVPPELSAAYRSYADAGRGSLRFPSEWGGEALPRRQGRKIYAHI